MWISDSVQVPPIDYDHRPRVCLIGSGLSPAVFIKQHRAQLDTLLAMISSSVPIAVNTNLNRSKLTELVMNHYEKQFEIERLVEESTTSADYERLLKTFGSSIINAALQLTGSSLGNLYLSEADSTTLSLVSEVNNANRAVSLSLRGKQTVVTKVHRTAKPLIINDLNEFRRNHPNIDYRWVGARTKAQPYAELAVPIVLPNPGTPEPVVLGVLNVEKIIPKDAGYYSDNDLATLRLLALRFCLWRARLISAIVNKASSHLTPTDHDGFGAGIPIPAIQESIPRDYYSVQQHLQEVLRQAYYLTRSKTATIRLLSTDTSHLVRFCALPVDAKSDPHRRIAMSRQGSVNAHVARTGKACYIRNVQKSDSFDSYHPLDSTLKSHKNISSEYCLPIVVRNRLIGTMNLESEYENAYSGEKHFLNAVLEQVRLALEFAQTAAERSILSTTAQLTLNTHEVMKCAVELGKNLPGLPAEIQSSLRAIEKRLKACTRLPNRPSNATEAQKDRTAQTYWELLKDIIEARNIGAIVDIDPRLPDQTETLTGQTLDIVRVAVGEVLANSLIRISRLPEEKIRIGFRQTVRGGRKISIIKISHLLKYRISKSIIDQVYRVPIAKPDRDHIGAFLAGSIIRAIGGDITFKVMGGGLKVLTSIEIPAQ